MIKHKQGERNLDSNPDNIKPVSEEKSPLEELTPEQQYDKEHYWDSNEEEYDVVEEMEF